MNHYGDWYEKGYRHCKRCDAKRRLDGLTPENVCIDTKFCDMVLDAKKSGVEVLGTSSGSSNEGDQSQPRSELRSGGRGRKG